MVQEIIGNVVTLFLGKVTEYFLDRRRDDVPVSELQDQVAEMLAAQQALQIEMAEARKTVLTLTRYLVLTHGDAFLIQDGRLCLAEPPGGQRRAMLGEVIEEFDSSVRTRLRQRMERRHNGLRGAPAAPDSSTATETPATSDTGARSASEAALDAFFDGFDDEILRARLGQQEN